MRNIIFLDIDGVLNHEKFFVERFQQKAMLVNETKDQWEVNQFCQKSVDYLNNIITECNAEIVVSSTWRNSRTVENLQKLFDKVGIKGSVIGKTGSFYHKELKSNLPRGIDIKEWLYNQGFYHINWNKEKQLEVMEKSNINNYLILDDDSDMLYCQRNHFCHILPSPRNKEGLNEKYMKQSIEILSKNVVDLNYEI